MLSVSGGELSLVLSVRLLQQSGGFDVLSLYSASNLMNTLRRIGLWFGSLLHSVTLFSLLFSGAGLVRAGSVRLIFRVTYDICASGLVPVPALVIALKDSEERRIWTILFSGILIGPASLALWGLILQLRCGDPHKIWQGDPLIGLGVITAMTFALIVGFLTTSFYVIALRILHRRSTAAKA